MTANMPGTIAKIRRPCDNCPWRVSAPRGHWDPQHFIDIWQHCQADGVNIMLCHKANALPEGERQGVPCQGWIRVMGFEAIGVRLLASRGQVTYEEVEDSDGPALFPTFAAMLRANRIPLPKRSKILPQQPSTPMRDQDQLRTAVTRYFEGTGRTEFPTVRWMSRSLRWSYARVLQAVTDDPDHLFTTSHASIGARYIETY